MMVYIYRTRRTVLKLMPTMNSHPQSASMSNAEAFNRVIATRTRCCINRANTPQKRQFEFITVISAPGIIRSNYAASIAFQVLYTSMYNIQWFSQENTPYICCKSAPESHHHPTPRFNVPWHHQTISDRLHNVPSQLLDALRRKVAQRHSGGLEWTLEEHMIVKQALTPTPQLHHACTKHVCIVE